MQRRNDEIATLYSPSRAFLALIRTRWERRARWRRHGRLLPPMRPVEPARPAVQVVQALPGCLAAREREKQFSSSLSAPLLAGLSCDRAVTD